MGAWIGSSSDTTLWLVELEIHAPAAWEEHGLEVPQRRLVGAGNACPPPRQAKHFKAWAHGLEVPQHLLAA